MAASPILPRNNADVTGQQRRVKGAINEFARRMRKVRAGMLKILADQQYQVITLNSFGINATTYQFLLDDSVLSRIDLEIAYLIDELMNEGTPRSASGISAMMMSALKITALKMADSELCSPITLSDASCG